MSAISVEVKLTLADLNQLVMQNMRQRFGTAAAVDEVVVYDGSIVVARFVPPEAEDEAVTYNSRDA